MQPLLPEFNQRVLKALSDRQAMYRPCPICTSRTWTLVNGVILQPTFQIAGRAMSQSGSLPSVAVVCNTCAFIVYYSLVALRLGDAIPK